VRKIIFLLSITFVFPNGMAGQDSSGHIKVDDISLYYAVIPFSSTYHLKNENIIGIQTNFASKNKFSVGIFAFYGTNNVSYGYASKTLYNPQSSEIIKNKAIFTFSGAQAGFGTSFYYRLIKRKRFILSPGISTSISFFTKADAEYGAINLGYDSLALNHYYSIEKVETSQNYEKLKDNLPDILLINLISRFQFVLSKRLTISTESFVSLIGLHKIYTYKFSNLGSNISLTWNL
jgi:hypothetical protein